MTNVTFGNRKKRFDGQGLTPTAVKYYPFGALEKIALKGRN